MEVYYRDLLPEYKVIDIRDRSDYEQGHFQSAVNIPYSLLLCFANKYLNKNETYYIYCTSGIRSKNATELLSAMGYHIVNVKDGYNK